MRWLAVLAVITGCSKLFGIDNIPYAGDAAPADSPPDAPLVAKLQLGSTTFDFGSIVDGKSSFAVAIQVTNVGDAPTAALAFTKSGDAADDFTITDTNACTGKPLDAGAGCTFSIAFLPTSSGMRDATLDVTDSVVTARATFTGVGLVPGALDMSPSPADFGMRGVGSMNGTKSIVLTNTGQTPLSIVSMAMTGDAGAFSFAPGSGCATGNALAGGASCTIVVTFTPVLGGSHVASLQVTTDAATAPVSSAALGGTGIVTATVTRHGNGTGSVASPGNEISCGGTCTATFATPMINLRGTADPLSAFTSWSTNCQPATGASCSVATTNATLAIDVLFTAYPHVTVSVTGTAGEVTGPNGLDCTNAGGAGCTIQVPPNSSVMLVPHATGSSVFNIWGGDCTGSLTGSPPPCMLVTDTDKTAAASFVSGNDYVVNIVPGPNSTDPENMAAITGAPTNCIAGMTCSFRFGQPTNLDLQATNSQCVTFASFVGDCDQSFGDCYIGMSVAQHIYTVQYNYNQAPSCPL